MTRREMLRVASAAALAAGIPAWLQAAGKPARRVFDAKNFGAVGDGLTPDTAAIQRAIDAAAAAGGDAQVLIRGGRRYLIGALQLKGGIEFHLADDAELLVSTNPEHFGDRPALSATGAHGLRITGTGLINGRSPEFMEHFDENEEWWRPKAFRPRLVLLTGCKNLEVRGITLCDAPSWTLHLLGCEHGLVAGVTIRNQLDVPNCDGIDPDHCRDLEIRNCRISCGDDAIVVKTTRQNGAAYGPSARIRVSDCVIETQDSGLKIGTETTEDITGIVFERCEIKTGCRGLCIQLRDAGNVSDVEFRDITFTSQYFSAPWWGRGEGVSLTAIPRTPETKLGTMSNIRFVNITGRAENSARICGTPQSRIRDVRMENVALTLDRWTRYPGPVWDNRPTTAVTALETHNTCGFGLRHADNVTLKDCSVAWGRDVPDYFTHAIEAEEVTEFTYPGFRGEAAHPDREKAIVAP